MRTVVFPRITKKFLENELEALSLTRRFDIESSKLISLKNNVNGMVQCNK